jgi:hypothetical protein
MTFTLKPLPSARCGDRWAVLNAMGKAYGIFRHIQPTEALHL